MPILATNIVQNMLSDLGQVSPMDEFAAINGSATTFVAGTSTAGFGLLENPPETDVYKGYLAIVKRDAGGAGASPEGKWGIVSGYVDTTWTGTIPTVTDAIAVGDTIMLAKQDKFPLPHILSAINRGLESLGDLPSNADTSLTLVGGQYDYNIPVAAKRGLKQVLVDDGDTQYKILDWDMELTAGGTAAILHLQSGYSGTLRLIYDGPHAVVSAYNSTINEYVHPKVVTAVSIIKLLEWYNRLDENQTGDGYFLELGEQYRNSILPVALMENPIPKAKRSPKYALFGKASGSDWPPLPYS